MGLFGKKQEEVRIRTPRFDDEAAGYAFRRSRTLTGSSSDTVRTAGESRAQIKSPRLKEHELKRHRNVLLLSLVGAFVVIGLLGWLMSEFSAGSLEIRSSTQLASQQIDSQKYQKILNSYYASRPLERFHFALQSKSLLAYIQREAPEVESLSIDTGSSSFGGRGVATLTFREPLVGWQIRGRVYLIDKHGMAFEKNYYGSPLVTVHDASGINPDEGVIASSRFLSFLGKVVSGVNASGVGTVNKVTLPPGLTREIDINLAGKPYRLKLQMDREPTGQVADIVAAVRYLDAHGITPTYVDVRVPSKAFWK